MELQFEFRKINAFNQNFSGEHVGIDDLEERVEVARKGRIPLVIIIVFGYVLMVLFVLVLKILDYWRDTGCSWPERSEQTNLCRMEPLHPLGLHCFGGFLHLHFPTANFFDA